VVTVVVLCNAYECFWNAKRTVIIGLRPTGGHCTKTHILLKDGRCIDFTEDVQ
jgi:hypothetical protein